MKKLDNSFWDEYFRLYDVLNIVYPYQDLLKSVMNEMNLKSGITVLDAGTGTGNLGVLISQTNALVTGLDLSEVGLRLFKQKIPNSEILLHDLIDPIPLSDNSFDYICCINTLFAIKVDRRLDVCREFYRLLKPGGKIIMTNLSMGYKPINIYINHVLEDVKYSGYWKAIAKLIRLIYPTFKMLYYSQRLGRENRDLDGLKFFAPEEQYCLLQSSGFRNISTERKIFAEQAVLSTGFK